MPKYDVFLSYAHGKDDMYIPLAKRIHQILEEAGLTVWLDVYDMKGDETKSMDNGIRNSRIFLALISPDYMKSYDCNYEFSKALDKKPMILCSIKSKTYYTSEFKFLHSNNPDKIKLPIRILLKEATLNNDIAKLLSILKP